MEKRIGNQLNKYAAFCACIHFLISFFSDRLIFTYSLWDFSDATAMIKTIFAWGSKAVFFLFLLGFWQFLFWFVKAADRSFVRFFLLYFCFMCLLLILVWPGIWRMDEFGILFEARNTFPVFWQHYLTSIFYVLALMLIPVPAGVILLQNFCISLIVGWLLYRTKTVFFKNSDSYMIYFLYLPFCFFPVLDSNLYPMRMSLYAYLELLLLAELVLTFRETASREKTISNQNIIALAILTAVVVNWRTEAIYYILAIPICFLVLFQNRTERKVKIRFIIFTLTASLLLMVPQKAGEKLFYHNSHEYELTSILLPVVPLIGEIYEDALSASAYPASYEEALEIAESDAAPKSDRQLCRLYVMDRVLDVKKAAEASQDGETGIHLYWSDSEFVREYTNEQYANFKKIYWQLVLENPGVFLKERIETFFQSADLLEDTTKLFREEGNANHEKFGQLPLSQPLQNTLRTKVISMLELRDGDDYQTKLSLYFPVYSVIPSIAAELAVLLGLLWKRKWGYALLLLSHMTKIPLIFLTAPSRLFMYYYPIYLTGYVLVTFLLVVWLERRKNEKRGKEQSCG